MRNNQPVTNNEVVMDDGQVIISETNLKGIITEVDQDFIDISGFTREELIGKNHNIIRHPDMPPSAFQWLWDTIRAGQPWTGLVKNRCKNGDFYWVQANVTPVFKNGQVIGYVSVRTKPGRAEIEAAQSLYQSINAGKVVLGRKSLLQKLNFINHMKLWQKMVAMLLLTATLLSGSWYIALQGLKTSNDDLLVAGNDRKVALAASDINMSVLEATVNAKEALTSTDPDYNATHQFLAARLTRIDKDIAILKGTDLGEAARAGANAFLKAVHAYVTATLRTISAATKADKDGEFDLGTFGNTVIHMDNDAFKLMEKTSKAFHDIQSKVSIERAAGATAKYHHISNISMTAVAASLLLTLLFAFLFIRSFSRRLKYTTEKLGHIAEGNYFDWVKLDSEDEIGVMQAGLKSMQITQGYNMLAINEQAEAALRIKVALDQVSGNVMIADANLQIFYMNSAMQSFMQKTEGEFRKQLPNFKADALIGSCIDQFHANPSHQRNLLNQLTSSYESEDTSVGGCTVRVTATPILNEAGERIATVAEWVNRTAEVAVEREVGTMVAAVQQGDLSVRLSNEGRSGFFAELVDGLNSVTETVDGVICETTAALHALEEGDLTYRMTSDYTGSYDVIKEAANNTMNKLTDVIGDVNASAEEVSLGSGEIAEGNNTLNTRTQEQAAALEETAASIEEITGTVQQTADNSRQANQLASDARDQAEKGGEVANQAVQAMAEINTSSRKISDIIGVIDEIAFQTNLLALNAAVEAARAGEQGRGFAVVAGEVRTLAQRSAEAAKEIKTLINSSVESVDHGSKLVDESGAALNDIRGAVAKVSDIIAEIAAASVEQTAGVDQINKAIAQLDSGTQQNTAMVEESAAASQRLNDQAAELRNIMSVFQLD